MRNAIPRLGTISCGCRLMLATAALGLLLAFGFAQTASAQAQTNPLNFFKNYIVSGDSVVAGVGLRGQGVQDTQTETLLGTTNFYAKGTIQIGGVPANADILAAYLYWETTAPIDSNPSTFAG